jgi:hypothetical protein
MEAFLQLHKSLSQQGRATRPWTSVEAMLAACRECPHWLPSGCGRRTAREFAALLADSQGICKEVDNASR